MEHRWKLFRIHAELLIRAIAGWGEDEILPKRYRVEGLPAGWRVDKIGFDLMSDCLLVRVYHDSFEIIADGGVIPEILVRVLAIEPPRGNQFI